MILSNARVCGGHRLAICPHALVIVCADYALVLRQVHVVLPCRLVSQLDLATLLVARARTQTCSRVHLICQRHHASPSPALMSLLQSRACTLSAELAASTLKGPTKILMSCNQGTCPLSASVESVILGVLNASLPSQSPELDFQLLELDKLAHELDNLPCPQPPDDNLNFPRTPSPTMHASYHSAYSPKTWGA